MKKADDQYDYLILEKPLSAQNDFFAETRKR